VAALHRFFLGQACGSRIIAISIVCSLTACTSLRVTSDVNTSVTTQCHTFDWAGSFQGNKDSLRSSIANPLNENRLRTAIAANLQAKGVQPVSDAAAADCLVGYGIGARDVLVGAYPVGWGWGWGWGGGFGWRHGYGGVWGWDEPYIDRQGVIAVDLYDARSKQPLWHASVDQSLYGLTGEKADKKINEAVAAIFTKYPH
jgi:Domain of unknown function (DUF4136)